MVSPPFCPPGYYLHNDSTILLIRGMMIKIIPSTNNITFRIPEYLGIRDGDR